MANKLMRVSFKPGKQRELINKVLTRLSVEKTARLCGLSARTIRDWKREKFLMDYRALKLLCAKTHISFPKNIELKPEYWYAASGAMKGYLAVMKKCGKFGGDSEYRKKKWFEWWEREGKYKPSPILGKPFPIKKPRKSKELAEFVGIVLGDGGITKNQIAICLNRKDDKEYGEFVVGLIRKLFDVPVGFHYDKHSLAFYIVISRRELVRFCINELGLKIGNKVKQQVDIPQWIKDKKQYALACLRGLVDTDGCVFNHRYKVNNKWYLYKKLSFSNRSIPLLNSCSEIFRSIGLNPGLRKNLDVRLESISDIGRYSKIVGYHNPKNLNKYLNKV